MHTLAEINKCDLGTLNLVFPNFVRQERTRLKKHGLGALNLNFVVGDFIME